jgi:hypothetical protein
MAIVISGVNNNDKITASDGTIDLLSGVTYTNEITAPSFKVGNNIQLGNAGIITATSFSGNNVVANHFVNVGSNIQLGNAGVATATTFVGNLTGNVNNTGNLLLQIGGSEKFRVGGSGQLGIAGANYGTSGQVLTSGGSGSAVTWSTINGTTINNNADNRVITGSGTANTLEGEANLTFNGGVTGDAQLTVHAAEANANSDSELILETSNDFATSAVMFKDTTGEAGSIAYNHGDNYIKLSTNGTDGGTERLRITSDGSLTQTSTKAFQLAKGTTAERPTGVNGMIRYNTSNNVLEGYINGSWVTIKGTGLAEEGKYASNPQATADDLYAYWDCDSTSTSLAGGDSGQATLYSVSSSGGQISNSWDRGTGANNGVLLTSMPTGNNFTLMFWAMLTDNTIHSAGDGAGIVWLDGALSGGNAGSVILGYDGSGANNLRFGGNGWVNDGVVAFSSYGTTNVWRHMTITRDGSGTTWKFYLDGALNTTRTETMAVGSSWMLGNYSRINGNGNTNNHYFRGRFDEIAVWDRTLTATEITKVYDTQYAGTGLL